jgi:hypothetical protein
MVAFLGAVLQLRKNPILSRSNSIFQLKKFVTEFVKLTPKWVNVIFIMIYIYALVNSFILKTDFAGIPEDRNGVYVLTNHGKILKTISEEEYHIAKAKEVSDFSIIWVVFYSFSVVALWPFKKDQEPVY